ncbi:MAG: 2-phospho-L-lactate transferase [Aggregatilineales bacterium]
MALNVVALAGGVGGAKFAYGLSQILGPGQLTVIVNTGDDFWHLGLRICPDLDTVMYTLAGVVDPVNGWGVAGDTTHTLQALGRYGAATWFRLGDQDIATHILRTDWLRSGRGLTDITRELAQRLGICQTILPMTDAPVATMVDTVEHGEIGFQEYFVMRRWQPVVRGLRLEGIESAKMTDAVAAALAAADVIIIGPSNPWLSIGPILAVSGMLDAIVKRSVPRVAITPIIQGRSVKGPASKLMAELGYEPSAKTVAEYYAAVINGFVYDERDAGMEIPVPHTATFDTIINSNADRVALARKVLDWISGWRSDVRLGDHTC